MQKTTITRDKTLVQTAQGATRKDAKAPRKSLYIRVSSRTFQKLVEMSENESINQWKMLNRIIVNGIPQIYKIQTSKYKFKTGDSKKTFKDLWNEGLLKKTEKDKRYKGTKGSHKLNHKIYLNTWKQLHCLSNDIRLSKARIIQTLIDKYKPTTLSFRKKQQKKRELFKVYFADMKPIKPSIKH